MGRDPWKPPIDWVVFWTWMGIFAFVLLEIAAVTWWVYSLLN